MSAPDLSNLPTLDETTAETVRNAALAQLGDQSEATNLGLLPRLLSDGLEFVFIDTTVTAPAECVLVFADDQPLANWGHPCRYQFFDTEGTLLADQPALFPPDLEPNAVKLDWFHVPVVFPDHVEEPAPQAVTWRTVLGTSGPLVLEDIDHRYAVLFTSLISNRRHVEDLELLYRTLTDVYGFATDHIRVICFDGTVGCTDFSPIGDWDGDKTPYQLYVDASAAVAAFEDAVTELAGVMSDQSLLFVHTNNHGAPQGLCIDTSTVVDPYTFGTIVASAGAIGTLVVTMEQCYSGAFQRATIDNSAATQTVFTSAVPADKVSAGDAHFDPWARNFIEALRGGTAYGLDLPGTADPDGSESVSMREAFDYSVVNNNNALDDPQYEDKPSGCGDQIFLGTKHTIITLPDAVDDGTRMADSGSGSTDDAMATSGSGDTDVSGQQT
ncbi:MAG: hypothetical protein QOC60_1760 [Frankiaceae bacterium]|nr:hypothetical protein [Frankiaceae bacterium]